MATSRRFDPWWARLAVGALGASLGALLTQRAHGRKSLIAVAVAPPSDGEDLDQVMSRENLVESCERIRGSELRSGGGLGLVVIDLDRFGEVREAASPDGAAELVRVLGRQLVACVADAGRVARTGDQEFVIAVP